MESPKPYRETRPWGEFIEFTHNTPSTVKIVTVSPDQALSLQYHEHREEFWHIISGNGTVTIGDAHVPANPGDDYFVPFKTPHRLQSGSELLVVLEIAFGDFDENDIVRLEDRYGRIAPK